MTEISDAIAEHERKFHNVVPPPFPPTPDPDPDPDPVPDPDPGDGDHESPEPPTPPDPGLPPPPTGPDKDGTGTTGAWPIPLMPVRSGMKVLAYTNFDDETRTLGQGFGPKLLQIWRPRPDVARDSTYNDSSGRGRYSVRNTYEQKNSLARFFIHSSNADKPLEHNPNGSINWVYAPLDQRGDLGELFVQFTCKFPQIPGRKMAHLLWHQRPESWGEMDLPEGKLDGGACKGNGFHHHYQSSKQSSVKLCINLQEAHHFGTYFRRKGYRNSSDSGEVIYYVDGKEVFRTSEGISPKSFHWVGQFETYLKGQAIPTSNKGSGWAEYDRYRIDGTA